MIDTVEALGEVQRVTMRMAYAIEPRLVVKTSGRALPAAGIRLERPYGVFLRSQRQCCLSRVMPGDCHDRRW